MVSFVLVRYFADVCGCFIGAIAFVYFVFGIIIVSGLDCFGLIVCCG